MDRAQGPPESRPRLRLRPLTPAVVRALLDSARLDGWAPDYPSEGDLVIAGLLDRAGPDAWTGAALTWGHRQVIERASGLVVGGIGFLGPPGHGEVEVGYGIVPSRRCRGYATEAVGLMAARAWRDSAVTAVLASISPGNDASRRVLEKAGFRPSWPSGAGGPPGVAGAPGAGAPAWYRLDRPTPAG